jgi:nucleotide-binding universal stress UspA family protein
MTPHAEDHRRPLLVIGYDGSAASRAAIDHALAWAGTEGHLVIVRSCQLPLDASTGDPGVEPSMAEGLRDLEGLEETEPRLAFASWEREITPGPPADVLCHIAEARGADAIVLGTRGVGRFGGLLGSVAHDVLHRASCPVVAIPERMVAAHEQLREELTA